MQHIQTFNTEKGPKALGPYSTGKIYQGVLYLSGQIGIVPATGELVSDDVEEQATQAMKNLKTIVEEAKAEMSQILKCTLFLAVLV